MTTTELDGSTLAVPLVSTYTYTSTGQVASLTQANGVVTTYQYDSLDRLIYQQDEKAAGQVLDSYRYTLDALGHRIAADEFKLKRAAIIDEVKITWTYDALGRSTGKHSVDVRETHPRPHLSHSVRLRPRREHRLQVHDGFLRDQRFRL